MTSQSVTSQSAKLPALAGEKTERTIEQKQRMWGWIFLSPWIIGFLAFTAFPMVASLIFSFTNFTIKAPLKFVGLSNWQKLFTDPTTLGSLGVTARFALYLLPISIIFPLLMATLLNSKLLLGRPFFRLFFYMPYIVPAISGIFVWQAFLNKETGWLNRLLRILGVGLPPNWLEPPFLNTGLAMIALWGVGNAMLTMMASMQGVPTEMYEAASIDGAGALTRWRRITLPMISPVIFYNLVLTTIGLMQYFTVPYVLTNSTRSDPNLNFINLHLYRTAFDFDFDMGFASAIGWLMFIIGLAITIALFASSRRWVYYASGDN